MSKINEYSFTGSNYSDILFLKHKNENLKRPMILYNSSNFSRKKYNKKSLTSYQSVKLRYRNKKLMWKKPVPIRKVERYITPIFIFLRQKMLQLSRICFLINFSNY